MAYIVEIETPQEIEQVAELANEIWHEHYEGIISVNQIDYMVAKYQSEGAVSCQIEDGYIYYGLKDRTNMIGYLALHKEDEETVFLSKIYILSSERGKGYGSLLFQRAKEYAQENGCHRIYLTVNRNNDSSVAIYKKKGFEVTKEVDEPIGRGFLMNDYIMEWNV